MKIATEAFNDWYNTKGVRTYSKDHGTADGHKEYMQVAFLDGYHLAMKDIEQLLLENDTPEAH
jgi:hypothetical protein